MDDRSRLSSGARLSISSNRKSQCLKVPTMVQCPFVSSATPVFLSHGRTARVQDGTLRLTQSESASTPCTMSEATLSNASREKPVRTHTRARSMPARAHAHVRVHVLPTVTEDVNSQRTSRATQAGAVAHTNAEARRQLATAVVGTVVAGATAAGTASYLPEPIILKILPRCAELLLRRTLSYTSYTPPPCAASR